MQSSAQGKRSRDRGHCLGSLPARSAESDRGILFKLNPHRQERLDSNPLLGHGQKVPPLGISSRPRGTRASRHSTARWSRASTQAPRASDDVTCDFDHTATRITPPTQGALGPRLRRAGATRGARPRPPEWRRHLRERAPARAAADAGCRRNTGTPTGAREPQGRADRQGGRYPGAVAVVEGTTHGRALPRFKPVKIGGISIESRACARTSAAAIVPRERAARTLGQSVERSPPLGKSVGRRN
jgi:hypothetical protein